MRSSRAAPTYSPTAIGSASVRIGVVMAHGSRHRQEYDARGADHALPSMQGRAHDLHGVAELRRNMRRVRFAHRLHEQVSRSGDAAADDDPIGREEWRQRRQSDPEPAGGLVDGATRALVAALSSGDDVAHRPATRTLHEGRGAHHGFEATVRAARALSPVWCDDDMPQIARAFSSVSEHRAIEDDAAPEAGADGCAEQSLRALPGAVAVLADGGGIRVHLEGTGNAKSLLERSTERIVAQQWQVRVRDHRATLPIEKTRDGNADARDRVSSALRFVKQWLQCRHDAGDERFRIAALGGAERRTLQDLGVFAD